MHLGAFCNFSIVNSGLLQNSIVLHRNGIITGPNLHVWYPGIRNRESGTWIDHCTPVFHSQRLSPALHNRKHERRAESSPDPARLSSQRPWKTLGHRT
jgi:hypothetical protein